jgi:hypothetical protein
VIYISISHRSQIKFADPLDMRQESHVSYATNVASGGRLVVRQKAERLTRREREIMNAIFELGNRASAEEVRSRMPSPPSYSSVRVMLTRLEKKGVVKHEEEGLRYISIPLLFRRPLPSAAHCGSTCRRSLVARSSR